LEGFSVSAADEYFKKAEHAIKKGNHDYAIELISQGLIINPKEAEWRKKLHRIESVSIQEKGGNPQGGMGIRLKVMPMQANIKKLTMQKKWDEAVIEIEKCLRLQPQSVPTLFALGVALENLEAVDSAIGTLEEVIEHDKANVEAYRKLGVLWAKKGEPEKAISYWEKVTQYKPDDKEGGKAIRDLSAATMVKKAEDRKKQTGDESFKALLKSEEESAELEKKSKIIRTDEDRLEAVKWKKDELKKDPTNSKLWRELGGLYQDLKNWAYAEAAFKKALEVNPQDLFAGEKMGALREARLDEEHKKQVAEIDALRASGQDATAAEEKLKQLEAQVLKFKVDEYDRRVKAHPTDYDLKVKYGDLLRQVGRFDDAIRQLQQSVKDPKLKIPSLNLTGICFVSKGLFDVAENQFTTALAAVADKESELAKAIKYNLGDVCERKGNKDAALNWYQQIMASDIGYRDVSERVSRLMNGSGG
jgi:tetratricopeptide (TPR) repeat protein